MGALRLICVIGEDKGTVGFYIDRGAEEADANKRIFDRLLSHKEQIETAFGAVVAKARPGKQKCRVAHTVMVGGWRSDEAR